MRRSPSFGTRALSGLGPATVAVLLLTGCGREEAPAFAVRDSAGVEIVESLRPQWGEGEGWRIGGEALLRIGVTEGDPAYEFSMLAGGARLDDGTVVVADGGSQELRFFDGGGAFLKSVGRRGGGPGEFTGLAGAGMAPGGLIWAYDFSFRRITWVRGSGEIVRFTTLGPEPPVLQAVGPLPGGSFAFKQLWGAAALAEATSTGFRRDPVVYVRFDTLGALLDTVGVFPGREVYVTEERGRGVMSTPLVARNSVGAVWGEHLVVGTMDRFELEVLSASGALLRIVRIPDRRLSLAPGEVETLIQNRIDATPEERRPGLRESLESMPLPDIRPAHGVLLTDALGHLWVAEWVASPGAPRDWTVLDREGRWLGEVLMPPRFFPWQIGSDWVLGVETDDLDVEHVVLHFLDRR